MAYSKAISLFAPEHSEQDLLTWRPPSPGLPAHPSLEVGTVGCHLQA